MKTKTIAAGDIISINKCAPVYKYALTQYTKSFANFCKDEALYLGILELYNIIPSELILSFPADLRQTTQNQLENFDSFKSLKIYNGLRSKLIINVK